MNRPVSFRTAMMDLNDDCLREVFAHLNRFQLCDVADTCNRFRSLAQETFRTSKFKTLNVNKFRGNDPKYLLRLLCIFGEYIESISFDGREWLIAQRDQIFEYVGRHCGRELVSMSLMQAVITDENVVALRPAIHNLQELELISVGNEQALLVNLPSWSPKLRALEISSQNRWANQPGLRQAFPELKIVFFFNVPVNDVGGFLRLNPQLKELVCNNSEDSIIRLVATHVPTIERLDILAQHAIFPENMTYLNQLRSLKVLNLTGFGYGREKPPAFEPAIDSMENLRLCGFDLLGTSTELTRLKNLKELTLEFAANVTATHIMNMLVDCRQLSHLTLTSCVDLKLSMDNIFGILRYGEALKRFQFFVRTYSTVSAEEKIVLNADSYLKMVKIVQSRAIERIGMEFDICSDLYVNKIPFELLAEHQHLLKLNIDRSPHFPRFH